MVEICNSLTQDIIIEILSWLPAKSLVNSSKLVCKAWYTLIHDHVFIKMHLNRGAINGGGGVSSSFSSNNNNNNNNSLICKSGNELFQLHPPFNLELIGVLLPLTNIAATKLDFDSSSLLELLSSSRLVCSCNGLLCLSKRSIKHNESFIILLNPSTRRFKVSSKQPIECFGGLYIYEVIDTYGFGCCYNSIDNIDEYKVIRIVCLVVFGKLCSRIDIYSMSSDSWTTIRDYTYVIYNCQSCVFLNGAFHCLGYPTTSGPSNVTMDTIVSFDIRDEEFRQVPIPLFLEPTPFSGTLDKILMNKRGCLAMIRFANRNNNNMDVVDLEIWVMKEYGIEESWTKEIVIRPSDSDPTRALCGFEISLRSNAYVLEGNQILIKGNVRTNQGLYREKLVLYDINKRKIDGDFLNMVGVRNEPEVDQVGYIETLVSLKSMNASFEQQ